MINYWGARKQEFYQRFLRLTLNSASCRAPNPHKMDLDIRVIDRPSQLLNLNGVLDASGSVRCSAVPGGNFLLLPEYFLALHIGALSEVHVNSICKQTGRKYYKTKKKERILTDNYSKTPCSLPSNFLEFNVCIEHVPDTRASLYKIPSIHNAMTLNSISNPLVFS